MSDSSKLVELLGLDQNLADLIVQVRKWIKSDAVQNHHHEGQPRAKGTKVVGKFLYYTQKPDADETEKESEVIYVGVPDVANDKYERVADELVNFERYVFVCKKTELTHNQVSYSRKKLMSHQENAFYWAKCYAEYVESAFAEI